MTIRYNGLDAIDNLLGTQGVTFVHEFGKAIERNARRNSKVKTGNLRAHNYFRMEGDEGEAGNDAEYAAAVNFGHTTAAGTRVPGDGFMTRAIDEAIADTEEIAARSFGGGRL